MIYEPFNERRWVLTPDGKYYWREDVLDLDEDDDEINYPEILWELKDLDEVELDMVKRWNYLPLTDGFHKGFFTAEDVVELKINLKEIEWI